MEKPPEIRVGEFRVALLSDGVWRHDGGCIFGVVPRELWQHEHPPDEHNRIRLNLVCPLVMRRGEAILIDTGLGNRLSAVERKIFSHGEGWLLDGLRALGMEPGDITHVVLTHLHFDHCGGVVRRRPSGALESSFARARLFVQRGELEVARGTRNERLRAAYRHVAECLGPPAERIEAVAGELEVVTGLRAIVSGGHTRDHQIVLVEDGADGFLHLGDMVPTRSHMKGPWNQAFDLDALVTMERKAEWLGRAASRRWWVSFAHDERILAARVVAEGRRFALGERIAAGWETDAS